jgi:transposase-like protein
MSQKRKTKDELSGANCELQKVKITREQIVAEYLTGNCTYRELGLKYDIPFRSICDWVLEYQGRKPTWREKMKRKREKETGMKELELP